MNIYIDCEFNEFQGDLISMALVPAVGPEFYQVLPCSNPGQWVKENVMPLLGKRPVERDEFQQLLYLYLFEFDSVHVVADWPEDIKHFCESLITGPGSRLDTPPLTMEVLRVDAKSALPHNALYDARALRDMLESTNVTVAEVMGE